MCIKEIKAAEVNLYPSLLLKGEISEKQAVNGVWEYIFQKKNFFGLNTLSEDQLSEFLIFFSLKIPGILKTYNSKSASFILFLKCCIKKALISWFKKSIKENIKEDCNKIIAGIHSIQNEENDISNNLIENTPSAETNSFLENFQSNLSLKRKTMSKKLVFIYACYSCNEIGEHFLKKLSEFLELDETELTKIINNLKKETESKTKKRQILIEKRNVSYYYQAKYALELKKLEENSNSFEKIKTSYLKKRKLWKKYNQILNKTAVHSPSCFQIAKEIGIKPRQVGFYLNHTKRQKNIFPFIDIPKDENKNEE